MPLLWQHTYENNTSRCYGLHHTQGTVSSSTKEGAGGAELSRLRQQIRRSKDLEEGQFLNKLTVLLGELVTPAGFSETETEIHNSKVG